MIPCLYPWFYSVQAVPHSRREHNDSLNDETFGSSECTSEDRAEEERKRRGNTFLFFQLIFVLFECNTDSFSFLQILSVVFECYGNLLNLILSSLQLPLS